MKKDKDIQKELEQVAPFLAGLKGEPSPFEVPKDYFNQLSEAILEQTGSVPKPTEVAPQAATNNWQVGMNQWLAWLIRPQIAFTLASILIVVVAGIFWLRPAQDTPAITFDESITAEEVTQYIVSNLDDFDLDLFIQASTGDEQFGSVFDKMELEGEQLDELLDDLIESVDLIDLEEML